MSFLNIEWSPNEEARVLAAEAEASLLAQLQWMTLKPKSILDLGCGVGSFAQQFKQLYSEAEVFAVDQSESMLNYAKTQTQSIRFICADSERLPFSNHSIDLIAMNFLLPWQHDINALLAECKRVLRADGLIMLSALGPDTLKSFRDVLGDDFFPQLFDMHDIGDVLVQQGFQDPVLEVDYCTLVYSDEMKLTAELKSSGMLSDNPTLNNLCTIRDDAGKWNAVYELIYAHAFAPSEKNEFTASLSGEIKVPLSHLRERLGRK